MVINNALAFSEDKGILFSQLATRNSQLATRNSQLATQPFIAASINGGKTNAPL